MLLISCSPLTSLRDNLVVTVQNTEGNETTVTGNCMIIHLLTLIFLSSPLNWVWRVCFSSFLGQLAVIHTMSIVEKVCWNDIFYLDGGGHVRLQLEFILSDEERNRIRSMVLYYSLLHWFSFDPFLLQYVRDCSLRVFKTMISAVAMEGVYWFYVSRSQVFSGTSFHRNMFCVQSLVF